MKIKNKNLKQNTNEFIFAIKFFFEWIILCCNLYYYYYYATCNISYNTDNDESMLRTNLFIPKGNLDFSDIHRFFIDGRSSNRVSKLNSEMILKTIKSVYRRRRQRKTYERNNPWETKIVKKYWTIDTIPTFECIIMD